MYIALNASSKLTGVVGVGVTTVPVTAGTGTQFAVGSNHSYVTFQDATNKETCKITGQSGDNLTVVRTKALSWAIGTVIECRPCAEAMADYAVAPQIDGSIAAALADTDNLGFSQTSVAGALKKITWANFKAALKTYFDGIYRAVTGDVYLAAGASVVFEGTTDDAFETTLSAGDPTADRAIALPNKSGTLAVTSDIASPNQIQPISVVVNTPANGLTISASALSLDFRSTTLGSGTVTTVSGTPANLVISSGSTLGTVNAVQSRIAVLAMNNAGTIELAAVNISGGNDLSETGVLSTTAEGGAGAADSANVVYSTTARSNLAYRVIGYIESTQATAGTWATAPSTIQGAGGQALVGMGTLGWGQKWTDVIGSRASGTTYYNTTGKPIQVIVTMNASTGTLVIGGVNVSQSQNTTTYAHGIVPPGVDYKIAAGTLNTWIELR